MNDFRQEMSARLADLREQGLFRELRPVDSPQSPHICVSERPMLNFSSNDYLGLANEASVKDAAKIAIDRFGAGAGASRLICGSLRPCHELEEALVKFKGLEAALSFSSGYATALGTIGALMGKGDIIVVDRLVHASIIDAARLCGATLRVFVHNDLDDLEKILKWAASHKGASHPSGPDNIAAAGMGHQKSAHSLIVTESVFSMDGDRAPLHDLVSLKEKYGAWLMLDEAHATGLYGPQRRGLAEAAGVADQIEVHMGTLGKAVGSAGGFICGIRPLIELLINRARSFIFSTAPVPAAAAAATAGLRFIQGKAGEERCRSLWQRVDQVRNGLSAGPWTLPRQKSAIIPLIVGQASKAVDLANRLREQGIYIPAIRYPTVARNAARLRLTVTAAHSEEDIAQLLDAFTILKQHF